MYRAAERTAPGMSYHEPPRRIAVEEFRLERLLQVMDGSGDRGLRDVALPRRLLRLSVCAAVTKYWSCVRENDSAVIVERQVWAWRIRSSQSYHFQKIEETEETKSGARLPFQLEIPGWGW